jgi:hypothetical protein
VHRSGVSAFHDGWFCSRRPVTAAVLSLKDTPIFAKIDFQLPNRWVLRNAKMNPMEPVTSLLTGHLAGKLVDRVSRSFRTNVIERWSKRRANNFFQQFCREVEIELAGGRSEELETLLDKMLQDEHSTELLFDAYRRVSLSRSKAIGPRVIGILTAKLAIEQRDPTGAEESMLDAAEQLYDVELIEFASFIGDYRRRAADEKQDDVNLCDRGILKIKWNSEQLDSNWRREFDVSLGPLNLNDSCGSWATKMESLGIIQTDLTEKKWDYQEDGERHIDQYGSVREITWWIITWDTYFAFADMIDRVNYEHATEQSDPPKSPVGREFES